MKRLGSYELLQRIATGGMAEVYVARRTGAYGFTKNVALKRILPQLAKDAEFVSMFIDEARLSARLSHPNLVEVFDFGDDNGELFMAMELVEGTTCAKLVRTAASRGETIPLEDTLHIVLNVLRGLGFAHEAVDDAGEPLGLVHRDVSPGNVLLSRTGVVKLGDFGIVRASVLERRTDQGQLKGKLGYMSPEQVIGAELDARSDLFTLTIVFAELLTGHPLFAQGPEIDILFRIRDANTDVFTQHAAGLAEDLRAVVYKGLARDPAERYQSAAEFAHDIETMAQRRRLVLGPARLAAYLEHIGLVKPTGRSGEYRFGELTSALGPASSSKPLDFSKLDHTPGGLSDTNAASSRSGAHVLRSSTVHYAGAAAESLTVEVPAQPALYRVKLLDAALSPPMPLAHVLEMLITGKSPSNATISRDNGPFLPASEHPELRRVASSSAHRWEITAPQNAPIERYAINKISLPTYLFAIAIERKTGVLYASQDARHKKIYFVEGMAEYASSTERSEMLGERLLQSGRVLPLELDMALALAPRYGGRLGDALIGLSILRPIELFRALVEQMNTRFLDLLRWRSGELTFEAGARSHEETLPHAAPLFELIAKAILEGYTLEELEESLASVMHQVLRPGNRTAASPVVLRLPDAETGVLLAVDGTSTLNELLERAPLQGIAQRLEVLRAVFLGLCARALVAHGWPPAELGFRVASSSIPTALRE